LKEKRKMFVSGTKKKTDEHGSKGRRIPLGETRKENGERRKKNDDMEGGGLPEDHKRTGKTNH